MAALGRMTTPQLRPPTEAESRLARESSRRLGPALASLLVPSDAAAPAETVQLSVCVPGQKPEPALEIPAFAFQLLAWFKNARFRVTLGISARTLIGPALERVYATPG